MRPWLKVDPSAELPAMVDWRVTRWGEDPFSCGAYSYMRVGSAPADVHALAAPEHGGRVHFAGEACSVEAGPPIIPLQLNRQLLRGMTSRGFTDNTAY